MAVQQDNNKKNSTAVLRIIGMVLLFGVLVFAVARVIVGSSPSTDGNETLYVDTEGDVLYAVPSGSVADMRPYESGVAVLTDSEMLYLDAGGSITRSAAHDYRNPACASYERMFVVYDRGTTDYRLEINAAVYKKETAGSDILTAAVGKKGNYAIATLADGGFQSKLYVYGQDGSLQFEWGSAKHFITAVALSDDGKHYAVALAGSDNAVYESQIQVFENGVAQALYTLSYADTTILAVDFMKNDVLAVLTDRSVGYVQEGVLQELLTYDASSLLYYDIDHGNSVSVLLASGYVDDANHRIYSWDKNADAVHESAAVAPETSLLSMSKRYFAAADEKNITVYDRKGVFAGESKSVYSIERLQVVGSQLFWLHENGISVCSVHNRLSQTEATLSDG